MKSINYTIPMESPWEVAINDAGNPDSSVKELPFMIQVEGFEFIPIHNFVPNKQKNLYGIGDTVGAGTEGDLAVFGDEQYISLDNGITNGYINYISKNITRNLNENINQNQNSEQNDTSQLDFLENNVIPQIN